MLLRASDGLLGSLGITVRRTDGIVTSRQQLARYSVNECIALWVLKNSVQVVGI